MTHTVEWFIDQDAVYGQLRCDEAEGADCRLICSEGCPTTVCDHEAVIDGGCCNAVDWIDNSGSTEESYDGHERSLVSGPVDVYWDGENWRWTYPEATTPTGDA